MIDLFGKLKRENLIKHGGLLLDLGSGNGRFSEPFFNHGYEVTMVDRNEEILGQAERNFRIVKNSGFKIINASIEEFKFEQFYDGIIMSNVLPFQKNKESIQEVVTTAFGKLNKGGFLYFTLFGTKDQWAKEYKDKMVFYEKEEAMEIIKDEPYFFSEEYGRGLAKTGDIKIVHIFQLLYIKQ